MQFIDLNKQYLEYKQEIDKALSDSINASSFILGKQVSLLEDKLAEYVGCRYCLTVANGTDALHIAELALGINGDGNVILPSFTWVSTAETIEMIGADIKFADINKLTFNIDPSHIESLIDDRTKLIIGVSIFGQTCELETIQNIANKYKISFLEDAAQSFGASIGKIRSCSHADISTTSFFPSKPLGCYGDGGAIFTNNEDLYNKCKLLARHGQDENKIFQIAGFNSRLDEMQAAILNVKLSYFDNEILLRQQVAQMYQEELSSFSKEIKLPFIEENMVSAFAQYTIQFFDQKLPKQVQSHLKLKGVPSVIYYSPPVHMHPAYNHHPAKLPNTEFVTKLTLSLPFHPFMSHKEVTIVASAIEEALEILS